MAFCSSNTEIISAKNYNDSYPSAKSCLPNNGTGFAASDFVSGSQTIIPASLTSAVVTLLANTQANAPGRIDPNNIPTTFTTNSASLRTSIQNEYCFYYTRYMWVLNDILSQATSTSTLTSTQTAAYTLEKQNAATLNSKLNQIIQILQELSKSRNSSLSSYYGANSGVNALNSSLDTMRTQLVAHSTQLQSASLETDVQTAMIDYTLEKNASSRNLLAVYAFMNIVAVGLLFYLYRSSKK